jgi:Response regulator containing CheY-like receiver domain and AraC-type DNA-binding domain
MYEAAGTQVKKMIDIIHRSYDRVLRLETIAGLLGYSSAYLGKVFKHATGENFNTYLGKVLQNLCGSNRVI